MSAERLDLDELTKLVAAIDFEMQRDTRGNQILVMDFENSQRLKQLLDVAPRLIEMAYAKQASDDNRDWE